MIPQTWENSQEIDKETGCVGDNDPLDIVDMTPKDASMYSLPNLKVIGCVSLIDEGELDWKILALEESYAKEHGIRDAETFTQKNPGAIKEVIEWFRTYKTYDGKPENRFGHDEKILSVERTIEVIEENHIMYKDLLSGKISGVEKLQF